MASLSFDSPNHQGLTFTGAMAISDSTYNTFVALASTKATAGTTYENSASDKRRNGVTAFTQEIEGALRSWLASHSADETNAYTSFKIASSTLSARGSDGIHMHQPIRVQSQNGSGDLDGNVWDRFKLTARYREEVSKTSNIVVDLSSALSSWS